MPSYDVIADDEQQRSLGTSGHAPRRMFSTKTTRSLGIIQFLFGIVCLVLAVCFPTLPQIEGNVENEGSSNCGCSSSKRTLHSVSINVLSPRSGEDKCILSVVMIIIACMFTINGIIGALSSFKIKLKEALNIANFFLGVPNAILSTCGIMLCSYAVYLDGARVKGGDNRNEHAAWFIAGIQTSCYLESLTSLFVVINCFLQMRSNSCVCKCSFMGTDCTCGCGNESRTVYEIQENDGFNDVHNQHEDDEQQGPLPFRGRDGTYADLKRENSGLTRESRQCVSENNGNDDYVGMNFGDGGNAVVSRTRVLEKTGDGIYVDMKDNTVGCKRASQECALEKDRARAYENVKQGDGAFESPSRECVSEGVADPQNVSQQHLEPTFHRRQSDTRLVLSSQSQQINPFQWGPWPANKASGNCYEDVVDVKKDRT